MKEVIETFRCGDLRVTLTRLSNQGFCEMLPRVKITDGLLILMLMDMKVNLGSFYWWMRRVFGDSGRYYEGEKNNYSFPFRLDVRKGNMTSIYVMHVTLRGELDFRFYKYLDKEVEGMIANQLHEPLEEFSRREMGLCIRYIYETITELAEIAPKPDFYFRTYEDDQLVFGCKDGAYFQWWFRPEHVMHEDDEDDEAFERAEAEREAEKEVEREAYLAFVKELEAIGPEHRDVPPDMKADDTLDYAGYGIGEVALIRRGEARSLMRQLRLRFGDEAEKYQVLLDHADTYMLACWSESILNAKILGEVFILPSIDA